MHGLAMRQRRRAAIARNAPGLQRERRAAFAASQARRASFEHGPARRQRDTHALRKPAGKRRLDKRRRTVRTKLAQRPSAELLGHAAAAPLEDHHGPAEPLDRVCNRLITGAGALAAAAQLSDALSESASGNLRGAQSLCTSRLRSKPHLHARSLRHGTVCACMSQTPSGKPHRLTSERLVERPRRGAIVVLCRGLLARSARSS